MTKNPTRNHLNLLIQEVQKMRSTTIDLDYLRRKVRPYLKTTATGDINTFTLKGTSLRVLFVITDFDKVSKDYQISVVSSKHQNKYLFTVYAKTNKDLLEKFIHKFNFFS